MDCPYCGSPVMIRGNRWECGYCGDSGILPSMYATFDDPGEEISYTFTASFVIGLDETWQKMKKSLYAAVSSADVALCRDMAQTVIYEISRSLFLSHRRLPQDKQEALNSFLQRTPEFTGLSAAYEILKAAEIGNILCESAGGLDGKKIGSFWEKIIILTQNKYPDLDDIFPSLGEIYQYFVSDDLNCSSYKREDSLRNMFENQWYRKKFFDPDCQMAENRLRRDDILNVDEDIRDILVKNFPEQFNQYALDEMYNFDVQDFFKELMQKNRKQAMDIWNWLRHFLFSISAVGKNLTVYVNNIDKIVPVVYEKRGKNETHGLNENHHQKNCSDDLVKMYKYVQVQFQSGGKMYSYRTNEETLAAGDRVIVPFGIHNTPKVGIIMKAGMYSAENAPYPPEKTKFVISSDDGRTAEK